MNGLATLIDPASALAAHRARRPGRRVDLVGMAPPPAPHIVDRTPAGGHPNPLRGTTVPGSNADRILAILRREPDGLTSGELSRRTGIRQAQVVGALRPYRRDGLVIVTSSPAWPNVYKLNPGWGST